MSAKKKNRWQAPAIIIAALSSLVLLNSLGSKKSASEKVQDLISGHMAAVIFVKSNTAQDAEFLTALKEAKKEMKGMGGVVTAGAADGLLEGEEQPPAIIVYDSHGNPLARISGTLDKQLLEQAVHAIATHSH